MFKVGKTKPRTAAPASKSRSRTTAITFTADDLASLARLVAAGQVLLQISSPVAGRVKAALTRMGLPTPKGL